MNENFCMFIRILPKFEPKGPINNKSALAYVMAWLRTGEKPLTEVTLTQVDYVYMWQLGIWVK